MVRKDRAGVGWKNFELCELHSEREGRVQRVTTPPGPAPPTARRCQTQFLLWPLSLLFGSLCFYFSLLFFSFNGVGDPSSFAFLPASTSLLRLHHHLHCKRKRLKFKTKAGYIHFQPRPSPLLLATLHQWHGPVAESDTSILSPCGRGSPAGLERHMPHPR